MIIEHLFQAARMNPKNPMNQAGRLMGRHCKARLLRAQARRQKLNRGHGKIVCKKAYTP